MEQAATHLDDARPVPGTRVTGRSSRPLPPGPRFWTPFGMLARLRRDPLAFCLETAREFGDIASVRSGPWVSLMIFHPDAIKHVLQDNNQNYVKGVVIAKTKVLIGEGLFTSEGSFWRRQRRLAQPAFHRNRLAGFVDTMTQTAGALFESWQPAVETQRPLDIAAEMSRLTLNVVGKTLFSMDLSGEASDVGRAFLAALEYTNLRTMTFFPLPPAVPTPRNLRFRRALRVLDDVVYDIIASRRRTGHEAGDLLAMLLAARDEDTGEKMSDRQLRDEVMTFVLAGHETTSLALAWACYLLTTHPDVEEQLREAVRQAVGERTPTLDDLPGLGYARRIVEETLRLYPPVWGFMRQAVGEDTIAGYRVPSQAVITICPYITHRHPAFWEEPERFDPERFTPEQSNGRPRFAYLPFSGGPRLCIGNEFALMEATLVLTMLVQRYRLALVPDRAVEPEVRLTLRPRNGILATIRPA